MSNIVTLNVPLRRQRLSQRTAALADIFAVKRRVPDDVFWLKENAEFLNIMECTGAGLRPAALENWCEFYEALDRRLTFFPQYYRFLLSMALDLEDLGLSGTKALDACEWVARRGFPDAELSDLQRGEARRLLERRGVSTAAADPGLDDRLRAFISRAETFAVPNKKAAYELTHIVFYLSEYGRRDPLLPKQALVSLEYAGVLAMLEQNMDLLAEVCVALRYAGNVPSAAWEGRVMRGLRYFDISQGRDVPVSDDYHEYLVSCWAACVAQEQAVSQGLRPERTAFQRGIAGVGPLRAMSSILYDLNRARSGDWHHMRHWIYDRMDDEAQAVLAEAEASSSNFDAFFEGFARASA